MNIFQWHLTPILVVAVLLFPNTVSAHQPRIVETPVINVIQPEISKAYYGTLLGAPQMFRISSDAPFNLYVNVLVPDISGQKTDVSAVIYKDGSSTPYQVLSAEGFAWKQMWEPIGHNMYLQGPEFKSRADAGEYEIRVSSPNNDSKYSIAVGEIESFDLTETVNAIKLVPLLKRDFFNESPIGFILSPMGIGYVVVMFILCGIFGLLYRYLLRLMARKYMPLSPRTSKKNIGTGDRLLRTCIGLALFFLAILTSWSPILLFFSGFCFFEAMFSWCGFYAAIGKTTCPIE